MKDTAVSSVISVWFSQLYSKMDANNKHKSTNKDDNDRPKKKSHKYNNSFLNFGFMFILQNGKEKP